MSNVPPGTRKKGAKNVETKGYRALKAFKKTIWWLISACLFGLTFWVVTGHWKEGKTWEGAYLGIAFAVAWAMLKFCYDQAWKEILGAD